MKRSITFHGNIIDVLKEVVTDRVLAHARGTYADVLLERGIRAAWAPTRTAPREKDLYIIDDMTDARWARIRWGSVLENAKAAALIIFAVYLIATSCSSWIKTGLDFSTTGNGAVSVLQILLYAVIVIAGTVMWGFGGRLGTNKDPNLNRSAAIVALYALLIILDFNMVNKLAYVAALQASMLLAFAIVYCQRLPAYLLQYNTEEYLEKEKAGEYNQKNRKK